MSINQSALALGRVLSTLLGMGQTRLELAGVELAQARQATVRLVVWAILSCLMLTMASVFVSAGVIWSLWSVSPWLGLALVIGFYLAVGAFCLSKATQLSTNFPPLFEATVAELGRDQQAFQTALNKISEPSASEDTAS